MRRHYFFAGIIVSAGFAAGYFANRRSYPPSLPVSTHDVYYMPVSHVEIHDSTMGAVVDFVKTTSHANVVVDCSASGKVSPDTPFTADISLHDVTLGQVLNRISATANDQSKYFTWKWRNGMLEWSAGWQKVRGPDAPADPENPPDRQVITCTYHVADLIQSAGPWERLAVLQYTLPPREPLTPRQRGNLLIGTLSDLVGFQSANMLMGQLVVSDTPAKQRAIYQIIQILRQAK